MSWQVTRTDFSSPKRDFFFHNHRSPKKKKTSETRLFVLITTKVYLPWITQIYTIYTCIINFVFSKEKKFKKKLNYIQDQMGKK